MAASHLTPLLHTALLRRVSMRTSGVPISFTANLRISLMARGALLLKPLQDDNSINRIYQQPLLTRVICQTKPTHITNMLFFISFSLQLNAPRKLCKDSEMFFVMYRLYKTNLRVKIDRDTNFTSSFTKHNTGIKFQALLSSVDF